MRGLDPTHKAARLANYLLTLQSEMLWLCHAAGLAHPAQATLDHFELLDDRFGARSARAVFGYGADDGVPGAAEVAELERLMYGAG